MFVCMGRIRRYGLVGGSVSLGMDFEVSKATLYFQVNFLCFLLALQDSSPKLPAATAPQ